jgi:hypothetical protein
MKNTEYIPYEKSVNINEYKAATDESIKLLNEFHEKAKENLCYSVRINQTYLNAVAFFFREDHLSNGFEVYYKFILNGSEFKVKTFITDDEWYKERMKNPLDEPSTRIALKLIHGRIADEIAKELLIINISELNKHMSYR